MKRAWEQKRRISKNLGQIKHRVAVYSGKGGVGKTTVAVNLAVTLAQMGCKVGILDADIDCPNVTKVLKLPSRPLFRDGVLIPAEGYGVKVISMAYFQPNEEEAIIYRGPMIHNAINQFMEATDWGELDYLIVDLPPGTSDAPLTVMQLLNISGFVVVSTPQELAKLDAKRSINMIKKLNLSIIGVVENFSGEIFGTGGGEQVARDTDVPFLGRLEMRKEYLDGSRPTVLVSQNVAREFRSLAEKVRPAVEAAPASNPAP